MRSRFRKRVIAAAAPAAAVAAATAAPLLTIFATNRSEFTFGLPTAVGVTSGIFLALFAVVELVQLPWRRKTAFATAGLLVLGMALTVWTQISFLSDYFAMVSLNQEAIDSSFLVLAAFNLLFIVLLFAVLLIFRRFTGRHVVKLSLAVAAAQLVSPAAALLSGGRQYYDFSEYTLEERDKFTFAAQDNVLLIVVDCLGEELFQKELTAYPELRELFRDFTCFNRMESPIPWTMYAVPAMLTGIEYPHRTDQPDDKEHAAYIASACRSEGSLFQRFRAAGYRVEGYPYLLKTISYSPEVIDNAATREEHQQSLHVWIDVWLNKVTPFFLKPLLMEPYMYLTDRFITPRDGGLREIGDRPDDIVFFDALGSDFRVGENEKVFKYLHLQGAHPPIEVDEMLDCNLESDEIRQMRGSLRVLERLFSLMRIHGVYDDALIVVTGDHTAHHQPEVVTLIKRPGESHKEMAINSAPARVSIIAGTILAEKGLAPRENSLFSLPAVEPDDTVRRSRSLRTIDLGKWKATGKTKPPPRLDTELMSRACHVLDNRLEITPTAEVKKFISIRFLVVENSTGREWTTTTRTPPGEELPEKYVVEFTGLPDGIYRGYLEESGLSSGVKGIASGNKFILRSIIPRFLVVEKGMIRLEKYFPAPATEFEFDRYVPISLFGSFPEVEITDGEEFISTGLRCGRDTLFTAHLPAIPPGAEAKLRIDGRIFMPFPVVVRFSDAVGNELAEFPLEKFGDLSFHLPVEADRPAGNYQFRFRVESMFPNRYGEPANQMMVIHGMELESGRQTGIPAR